MDDYLTKPFGVEELLARVRAVLRRVSWDVQEVQHRDILRYKEVELDPSAVTVLCRGELVKLARTEFDLLHHFMHNVGKALAHRHILQRVWGEEYGNERSIYGCTLAVCGAKLKWTPPRLNTCAQNTRRVSIWLIWCPLSLIDEGSWL